MKLKQGAAVTEEKSSRVCRSGSLQSGLFFTPSEKQPKRVKNFKPG